MFLHKINLFILMFIFIFGWKILNVIDLIFISSIILILYVLIRYDFKISKEVGIVISVLYILSTYTLLIALLNGVIDLQFAFRTIRSMINFAGGVALVYLYKKKFNKMFLKYIILHLYLAIAIHGTLMVCMYFSNELRSAIYGLTSAYSIVNPNTPFLQGYRIPGLTYGLATTSVLQMFGLLLLPITIKYWRKGIFSILLLLVGAMMITLSILFSGNTGLFLGLLLFPVVLILTAQKSLIKKNIIKIGVSAILVYLVFQVFLAIMPEYFYSYTLNKAEEVNMFFYNKGETKTIATLKDMYHLPQNPYVLLFGSGELGRGDPGNLPSDVGWVRVVFAVGLLGTIIMITPLIYGIWKSLIVLKYNRYLSIVTIVIIVSSIILHFKEIGLYTRNAWSIQSILLSSCFVILNHAKKFEIFKNNKISNTS